MFFLPSFIPSFFYFFPTFLCLFLFSFVLPSLPSSLSSSLPFYILFITGEMEASYLPPTLPSFLPSHLLLIMNLSFFPHSSTVFLPPSSSSLEKMKGSLLPSFLPSFFLFMEEDCGVISSLAATAFHLIPKSVVKDELHSSALAAFLPALLFFDSN